MSDINSVLKDYKKFIGDLSNYSEAKVQNAVSTISTKTNSKYNGDNVDQRVQLRGSATEFKTIVNKDFVDGYAFANESRELIYLEFGTRQSNRESLSIRGGFESGIDANKIAAPYKVKAPFYHKEPIIGRYYFLNTIDEEGTRFLKDFGK